MAKTMTIRRLGVLSFAKIQAMVGAVMGLIIGLFYAFIFTVLGAVVTQAAPGNAGFGPPGGGFGPPGGGMSPAGGVAAFAGIGLMMVVLMPILSGIGGFIGGALIALIYNLSAGLVGGLEIETDQPVTPYDPKFGP
jgi:hypothetical protein